MRKYFEAGGAVETEWVEGPIAGDFGLYLVEVWKAETRLAYSEHNKPRLRVEAMLEVRIKVGSEWKAINYDGNLRDVKAGEVRRHMPCSGMNTWFATITLENW